MVSPAEQIRASVNGIAVVAIKPVCTACIDEIHKAIIVEIVQNLEEKTWISSRFQR